MAEISHVRLAVPEQGTLNRILREGGAQAFPQWLYAEPGDEPRLLWWGVRGASVLGLDVPEDPARAALFPRPIDDWTEAPRGLVLATVDAERAASDLVPLLTGRWHDAGEDEVLGARCRRATLGRSELVLAEPSTEGYLAACLARFGEGPVAVALDGTTASGRAVRRNPVTGGPATWVRLGSGTAPYLLFLPAR
ncbi:MAG TPA: hypothetical protein VFH63_01290 [candidate division Zixibacteria bacterium]|nr:hypothetical protein [candidate division Zixibacteria bacterium]